MVYFKPQVHVDAGHGKRLLAKTFGRANARKLVTGKVNGRIGHVAFDPRGTPFEELPSVPPRFIPPKPKPFEPERFPAPRVPGWMYAFKAVGVAQQINDYAGLLGNLQEVAMSFAPGFTQRIVSTGFTTTIHCRDKPATVLTFFGSADLLKGCFYNQVVTGTRHANQDVYDPNVTTTARQYIWWCNDHLVGPTQYADYSVKFKRNGKATIIRPYLLPETVKAQPLPLAPLRVHPMVDPNSQPIGQPLWTTEPIPFWAIPYRQPNPERVSPERTEFGDVAPQFLLAPSTQQALEPTRGVSVAPDTGTQPIIRPPDHQFVTPGPNVKERKTRMSGAALMIWHGINWVSEAGDFVEAMYYSLPSSRRKQIRKRLKHKPSQLEMAQALYTYGNEISLKKATINIIEMEIGDYIVGQQAQWLNKAAKPFIEHIRSPLGIQSIIHAVTGQRVKLWSPNWKDINETLGLEVEGY